MGPSHRWVENQTLVGGEFRGYGEEGGEAGWDGNECLSGCDFLAREVVKEVEVGDCKSIEGRDENIGDDSVCLV